MARERFGLDPKNVSEVKPSSGQVYAFDATSGKMVPAQGGFPRQLTIIASDLNTHATNPKGFLPLVNAAGTYTFTFFYETLPTSAVAQTWELWRSAAGGAFAKVITFTFASATPMPYSQTGDVTITTAVNDRLEIRHTAGDATGSFAGAAGVAAV